jgi:hypothetical protein
MDNGFIIPANRLLPMLIIVNDNKVGKESIMLTIPSAAEQLFVQFSSAFTQPTFQRVLPLAIGAIIAIGRRTVTAVLWTMRSVDDGFIEPRRIVEVDGRRAMMMVVADELAPKVMEALKGLRDTIGQTEGVKAFPLNVEGQL